MNKLEDYLERIPREYELYKDIEDFVSKEIIYKKLEETSEAILEIVNKYETAFSVELTQDSTLFYTIKKGDITFFFEHCLLDEDKNEECVLTCFNGNKIIISKMRSLEIIINIIKEHFIKMVEETIT